MKSRGLKFKATLFAGIPLLFILTLLVELYPHTIWLYPEAGEIPLVNPMIGFAPSAKSYDLVQGNTLVYVGVTWRDLEPVRGKYDFAALEKENHLQEWRKQGKKVVFRLLCDEPQEEKHLDIPDWLYEETGGDGDWYDMEYGRGYAPNYENSVLIQRHRLLIEALGKRYGGDDFFFYIELGSLGHWGEWHVKYDAGILRLPVAEVREQYVQPYIQAFPHAQLLMRRPFSHAKVHGFGLYNDMTGHPESTEEWLNWIQQGGQYIQPQRPETLATMPEQWRTVPIGGEFTSDIPMQKMLGEDIEQTLDLIARSHMSFVGPKIPNLREQSEAKQGAQRVQQMLGYTLSVAQVRCVSIPTWREVEITLFWENSGIAPIYKDWPVRIYLLNSRGSIVHTEKVDMQLSRVTADSPHQSTTVIKMENLNESSYTIGVAILDPDSSVPAVEMAMKGKREDGIYLLGTYKPGVSRIVD